ncbi:hypothetical protein NUW58_g6096 [Xylaria curta]|uniref:Uncharacterized protein n=1 Tax=Xylaria curta TaxID=42375 RepID=A0ACC1NYV0_9PEZI|nr:hypothetical protein NUW58_g6096 [Xylaria curta]
MDSNRISTPWAHPEDWDAYRSIMTDLYMNRRKTMKDVKKIMENQHNFHATLRMYKMRFKKWGLAKNIKSKPGLVEDVRPERPRRPSMSEQKSNPPIAPRMGIRRVENHASIQSFQQLWTQSAIRNMAPPDCYKFAESTSYFIQMYFKSIGFPGPESSTVYKRMVITTVGVEWMDFLTTARVLLAFGHTQRAMRLIDVCCHQYRSLLRSQDMSTMGITLTAVRRLLHHNSGLAAAFLNFVCKMAEIVLGTFHPLSMLLHKLKEAGLNHLDFCTGMPLQYHLGDTMHFIPHPMMGPYGDTYYDMIQSKIVDASNELQIVQDRLQNNLQQQPKPQPNFPEDITVTRCRIALLYFYLRHYEVATEVLQGMLSEPLVDAHVVAGCYEILHNIAIAENKHELALRMIQKAIEASMEVYGYVHCSTFRKMARFESCLRSMGRLLEADKADSVLIGFVSTHLADDNTNPSRKVTLVWYFPKKIDTCVGSFKPTPRAGPQTPKTNLTQKPHSNHHLYKAITRLGINSAMIQRRGFLSLVGSPTPAS